MTNINQLKQAVEERLFLVNSNNAILFDSEKDDHMTENYTVNCFFDEKDLDPIIQFTKKLHQLYPQQLIYDKNQLHLTLLGQMKIIDTKDKIIETVQRFLDDTKIQFRLLGVGSSQKASSVTAYPDGFDISNLRHQLRSIAGGTVFSGPYENLGWINILRFRQRPDSGLLEALKAEINTDFGLIKPKSIRLLINSSRLLVGAQVIHEFYLWRG